MDNIEIDKNVLDKALITSDLNTIKNIFNNIPSRSVFDIINEKERFKLFVKKYDFEFIEGVLKAIENKIEQEHYSKNIYSFTKTGTHKFVIMLSDKAIRSNIVEITEHKYKKLNDLFYKCFQHVSHQQIEKNPKQSLIENVLTFAIKHNFQKNEDFVLRLSYVINNENLKESLPLILKKKLLTKEQKIDLIGTTFEKAYGLDNLQFMIKNYDSEIRTIFHQKLDRHLFWEDLSITNNYRNRFHVNFTTNEQHEKLVFLEQNQLGYTRSEMPYYLKFFSKMTATDISEILSELPNRELYFDMFSRDLNNFKNTLNPFHTEECSPQKKIFTELILLMGNKYWGDEFILEDKLSKIILKNELEFSLKEKTPIKKPNKV